MTNNKEWEKEFDEIFDEVFWKEIATEIYYGDPDIKRIKQFINTLLKKEREEWKIVLENEVTLERQRICEEDEFDYNCALENAIEKINEN